MLAPGVLIALDVLVEEALAVGTEVDRFDGRSGEELGTATRDGHAVELGEEARRVECRGRRIL